MISNINRAFVTLTFLSIILLSGCEDDSILNSSNSNLLDKIFVDINSKTFEFGTEDYPFRDIDKALSVAVEGSVIKIAKGTYAFSDGKLILKPGVSLEGEDPFNTIIKGDLIDENNSSLPLYINNITFDNLKFDRPLYSSNKFNEFIISNCKCNSINVRFDSNDPATLYSFSITNNDVAEKIYLHHGDGLWNNLNYIKKNRVAGGIYLENGKKSIVYVDSNYVEGVIKNTSGVETESYLRFNNVHGRIIDSLEYWTDWASNIIYKNKIFYEQYFPETTLSAIQHYGASVGILDNQIDVIYGSAINVVVESYAGLERNSIHIERSYPNADSSKVYYGMKIISNKCEIRQNFIRGGDFGIYLNSESSFVDRNQINSECGMYTNSNGDFFENIIFASKEEALVVDGAAGRFSNNSFTGHRSSIKIINAKNLVTNNVIDFGGGSFNSYGNNIFICELGFNVVVESCSSTVSTIFAKYNKWNHNTESDINEFDIYDGNDQPGLSIVNFMPFIE
ncbi:MAG: DUF1565 domain-containing protein [Ignavibacteriota bacterium]|jgi:hypothetical protein|nr:MAG: DUF1565 domain-containing protein [Chlorobiota bacterium]MBE7476073.1 DUF1565 domain-containing protein [Ignavibacteriales bacterium]MBL1124064.1 DUF1565 domain-containing protein [Ignavibacteriota bacterium]MCC7094462.1 DUF1565 domain-containing protein [Ignavibacteriaceae bacterium]MCE7857835.1 DUF1565 domain-containing protein [Ignavibacteria bacterium CHB3]MEB2295323.1 DUF1565 domain-containing protein [Ignavibacteria bacterium]